MPNMLWLLERKDDAYGELVSAVVAAPAEDDARLALVKKFRHNAGVTAFLFDDEATAHLLGTAADGIDVGSVLHTHVTPE